MTRFTGRRVIVTGGASGIGAAVAKRMVKEGAKVALWDLSHERLEEARRHTGAESVAVVDVSDHAAVEAAMNTSVLALGGLDILVQCAGILGPFANSDTIAISDWRKVFSVNTDGTFYCCRSAVPHLKRNGYGRIVLLSSIMGKVGAAGGIAYCASKAAVISLAKSLGRELAKNNITVNVLTPGTIDTPMTRAFPPDRMEISKSQIPMGRVGTVDEAASMICFVSSDDCSFSTGAVFDLSGGRADY
jgi:NAD(P)-dependent dehydrogenase (short-subunit alcohol dehydrogenase family)